TRQKLEFLSGIKLATISTNLMAACETLDTRLIAIPCPLVSQVLAASLHPVLLQDDTFPPDVRQRAQQVLDTCPGGSVGVYSSSAVGMPYVLQQIAAFISRRDGGVPAHPSNILFHSGSQSLLKFVLNLLSSGRDEVQNGVLTPVPYPHTLPRLLQFHSLALVPYKLKQEQDWAVDMEQLHRAVTDARAHCNPRALFICNPGMPTGQVQDRKTIERIIRFAAAEGLLLLVQEFYQDCVYGPDIEFLSYRKVLFEMGQEYSEHMELISFNSLSNGSLGECGLRGGYMELVNTDKAVYERLNVLSALIASPVLTQFALEIMINPPIPGEPSYQKYSQSTLSQNAQRGYEVLNNLKGVRCQPVMGGFFLYPRIDFPTRMIEEAKMLGLPADVLYCQMLLDKTGVAVGAGYENGSNDNTCYYIR
uniref:alanine transaminase n=1 Tax=Neogobius melanostomus TaxID=47308 RepID=A0A8C6V733_9GOBI